MSCSEHSDCSLLTGVTVPVCAEVHQRSARSMTSAPAVVVMEDGVCCNEACEGTCRACHVDKTGVESGVCTIVKDGFDPDEECEAAVIAVVLVN